MIFEKPKIWRATLFSTQSSKRNSACIIHVIAGVVTDQRLSKTPSRNNNTMSETAKMDTDDDKPTIKVNKRATTVPDESIQMPWVEKYRPAKLEDLVAHEDIVSILTKLIDNDNLPHLLLYGPPGTGKVSVKLLPAASHHDV